MTINTMSVKQALVITMSDNNSPYITFPRFQGHTSRDTTRLALLKKRSKLFAAWCVRPLDIGIGVRLVTDVRTETPLRWECVSRITYQCSQVDGLPWRTWNSSKGLERASFAPNLKRAVCS